MPKSPVYFLPVRDGESVASMAGKTLRLCETAFADVVVPDRPCAIKQHFGEGGNTNFVKPEITRAVVGFVKERGGQPFVTDTNTLYRGNRSRAPSHLAQARDHGFSFETLDAPVIIADGLLGSDQVSVPIENGKHFDRVRIAAAGHHAASAVIVTHVKGHCLAGFGGAIKNIGMGFAARAGKLAQHHNGCPLFVEKKCTACGTCVRWCPADAITLERVARLIRQKCIGCGECYALCPFDAIDFRWSEDGPVLNEKMCEHVAGFLANKRGRVGYLNFVIDLAKNCDCMGGKQPVEYPNIGILAGTDVVAVDKASADLAIERCGKNIWSEWWPESQYAAQFGYGEALGIGSQDYEIVEVS